MKNTIRSIHMLLVATVSFAFSTGMIYGQRSVDCNELLSEKIDVASLKDPETAANTRQNLFSLVHCGLDTVDKDILLTSPIMASILMDMMDSSYTYGDILNRLITYKQTASYQQLKDDYLLIHNLYNKMANIQTWAEDKAVLERMGVAQIVLQDIEQYLTDHKDSKLTYKELAGVLYPNGPPKSTEEQKPVVELNTESPIDDEMWAHANITYDSALSLTTGSKKPLLLFFTAYAAINSVKMTDLVLTDPVVQKTIKERFVFVPLYVDDRTLLPNEDMTIAERNSELEMNQYHANTQPLFVIVDNDGNKIDQIGYVNRNVFLDFLSDGLKQYGKR